MSVENHVFGLENFGNTCYCNSVMQALFNLDIFRDYIEQLGTPHAPNSHNNSKQGPGSFPSNDTRHSLLSTTSSSTGLNAGATNGTKDDETRGGLSSLKSRFSMLSQSNGNLNSSVQTSRTHLTEESRSGTLSPQSSIAPPSSTIDLLSNQGTMPIVGFVNGESAHSITGLKTAAAETDSLIEQRKRNAMTAGPILRVTQGREKDYGMDESLLTAVKDLFCAISASASTVGVASPAHLIEVLRNENEMFRSSMHQDAQEFLNFLLNRIMEEEDKFLTQEGASSLMPQVTARKMFSGIMTNEMRCLYCETVTKRNEQFFDFSLDTYPNTTVYHCLKSFCGNEVLGGTNKFYCDTCGSHEEAMKCQKVKVAPKVLILHLKRFKFNEELQENTKLLHRVLYSRYLRLPVTTDDCTTPEKLYELSSIIVHYGGGPSQGHYVALCKTRQGWLLYDDEIVDRVDDSFVYRFFGDKATLSCAYLLICQEVSEKQRERDNTILDDRLLTLSLSDSIKIDETLTAKGPAISSSQASIDQMDTDTESLQGSQASLTGSPPAGFLSRYESMRKKSPSKRFTRKR